MSTAAHEVQALVWRAAALELLDQRQLPHHIVYQRLSSAAAVAAAIRTMVVRGAPAIGIAAAYGVVLAAQNAENLQDGYSALAADFALLAAARPTAVNLTWALQRMRSAVEGGAQVAQLLEEAQRIHQEDIAANQRMGQLGAQLIGERCAVLTHCNAGALATGGYGTALGVIRAAHRAGWISQVYADETRPWLQGARLTAWELVQEGMPVTLLADGAAAALMQQGKVRWVIVGADRIAANGDAANKIGTYGLALAARYHGLRCMVVAPTSTIDRHCPSGAAIPIEERAVKEVLEFAGERVAAAGAAAWNPSFDVTPATLIDALVTERGVLLQPDSDKIAALF